MKKQQFFRVEVTDTFCGEANYSWVRRYKVAASTMRGAIGKVSRVNGYTFRKDWDSGDVTRYKAQGYGAAVCAFVEHWEAEQHEDERHETL